LQPYVKSGLAVYAFRPDPPSRAAARQPVPARDDPAKCDLLMRDAEQGHARAQRLRALRYLRGRGVAQDLAAAHRWLQAAARQGLALAQRDLGTCYEQGLGVARDAREARRMYLLAAAQGDPIAERCLQELATADARTP